MCYSPISVSIQRRFITKADSSLYYVGQVPCGKCLECTTHRQNDFVVRCYREATHRGTFHFLTLTYSPEYVPVSKSLWLIDRETGEIENVSPAEIVSRSSSEYIEMRSNLDKVEKSKDGSIFNVDLDYPGVPLHRVTYSYAVDYDDVQKFIKRFRRLWEYNNPYDKLDFSYLAVGEYGKNTARPHFHLGFFGLSPKQFKFAASLWKFGFIYKETVEVSDKSFINVSSYLAKYLSKGSFECELVKSGYVPKERVRTSQSFGTKLNQSLINYYRCFDLFGAYDLHNPEKSLTPEQLPILYYEIFKRSYYKVGNFYYKTPFLFRRKCFGVSFRDGVFYWSDIWVKTRSFISDYVSSRNDEEFRQYCLERNLSTTNPSSLVQFDDYKESLNKFAELRRRERLRQFYAKSKL